MTWPWACVTVSFIGFCAFGLLLLFVALEPERRPEPESPLDGES